MTNEELRNAMKRAYYLGQTYWQQADSEYSSHWKKADVTANTFRQLVDDTVAKLKEKNNG
jgi:hypothetical protein